MSSGYNLPLLLNLASEIDNLLNSGRSQIDDFAYGVYPHQLAQLCQRPQLRLVYPGNRTFLNLPERDRSQEKPPSAVGKDGFQVCMDVQQFRPNELTVKSLDNCIIIEGKHEEREDEHGFISRHFVRRYTLPKGYDPSQIMSTLSSDGVLTIRVPNPTKAEEPNVRVVQIQQTGPAHLSVKENQEEAATGEGDGDGKKE